MSRHDGTGVVSRTRRGELARIAKRVAGKLLLNDMDAAELAAGLSDAEDDIVRAKIRNIAEKLIEQGRPSRAPTTST